MQTMELGDGRHLTYEDAGDPAGVPVFYLHGTGDSRLCKHPDDGIAAGLGIRLISPDRPGVGGSTVQKHRTLVGWVDDLGQLADHLGVDTFKVAAHSGGAPHALAAAHVLGDRVTQLTLAAPLAPFDQDGTKKMVKDSDLKMIFSLAHLKFVAVAAGKSESKRYSKDIGSFVRHCAKSWPSDEPIFTDPVLEPMFEAEFLAAFQQGGVGALDDMWAFLEWDFDIDGIQQPVRMFVGDSDDILDPEMSTRIQKRLANSTLETWPGAGHYGVYREDRWTELLTSLT